MKLKKIKLYIIIPLAVFFAEQTKCMINNSYQSYKLTEQAKNILDHEVFILECYERIKDSTLKDLEADPIDLFHACHELKNVFLLEKTKEELEKPKEKDIEKLSFKKLEHIYDEGETNLKLPTGKGGRNLEELSILNKAIKIRYLKHKKICAKAFKENPNCAFCGKSLLQSKNYITCPLCLKGFYCNETCQDKDDELGH